ncbi:MAG: bifunctional methionine sulfoxide reductase B/A protein [Sphingobacteriales bacterium]|nr:MAG: bifunctional methionine sulfoxide reductase B/A protein [Sphingobacteriales bacterium]
MKKLNLLLLVAIMIFASSCSSAQTKVKEEENSKAKNNMNYNKLTPEEEYVIKNKGTERPFTGEYTNNKEKGTYVCRQCNAPLYRSEDKFESHCGWPSFDDEIKGAVKHVPDADGMRTEIVCANCGGHLGHVFEGEGFTDKNTRHCVNSISMKFIPASETNNDVKTERAIFASGCFWGTQYMIDKVPGVISSTVGYTGGHVENPTYKQVCTGTTGHAEALELIFDPSKVSYEELTKVFFETHDQSQINGQGPDIGEQYRSGIFYTSDEQKAVAEKVIKMLKDKGYDVATEVTAATKFYKGEAYHQKYYEGNGHQPYCHKYEKKF